MRRSLYSYRSFAGVALAALGLIRLGTPAQAVIDNNATQQIWKLKYGVTNAQLNDPLWLNKDDDGDGAINKDEIAAGTNPFASASYIRISSIVTDSGNAAYWALSFPTQNGKRYSAEGKVALANASWAAVTDSSPAVVSLTGDGSVKKLTVAKAGVQGFKFFRVLVEDIDTDLDGVSNWAEIAVTLNPSTQTTVPGVNDLTYVNQQIALPNVVTITASSPFASEDGPAKGTLTVARTQNLFPITVSYGVGGSTAVAGIDYTSLPGSLFFPARGVTAQDIDVTPLVQPAVVKGGRSVTATLNSPGAVDFPFTLGSPNKATVIINDSVVPTGTGLLGRYYDTANATYSRPENFGAVSTYTYTKLTTTTGTATIAYSGSPAIVSGNQVNVAFTSGNLNNALYSPLVYTVTSVNPGVSFNVAITGTAVPNSQANSTCQISIQSFPHPAVVERLDPTVNFDWAYGTPNAVTIAPNNSPDNYSATWDAYLQPTVAGDYTFQLDADDKARLLIDLNNDGDFLDAGEQVVEHNWTTPGADDVGTFKVSGLVNLAIPGTPAARYHMRVEHVETTGEARCRLQWKVPGTTAFANIPQANQFTHTQAMTYSYSAGNAVITPSGGHSFNVSDSVPLAFSSGVLFTPGAASSYNGTYQITAINGTTTYTVAITGFPIVASGAATTAGSNLIIVPSTASLAVGMTVTGTGLPANELITAIGTGFITVTTGTGVTAQANTTITAVLPATGTPTGNGFVLNNNTSTTTGLYNLCYANTTFSTSPGRVGVDAAVTTGNNGIWGAGTPDVTLIQPETFSARWSGQVQPQFSEEYTFSIVADDGCTLKINGQQQVLKMLPSASTGTATYLYDNATGNAVVNYTGVPVVPGSFVVGETVRIDPTSGNLSHAPTTPPAYSYDQSNGLVVVDYTSLTVGQPGGTVLPGSILTGDTIELDPTSGSLSPLGSIPYVVTAAAGNTFTVSVAGTVPTITLSSSTIASIAVGNPCQVTTKLNHNLVTGTTVTISGVSGGAFSPAINGAYSVTVTGPTTFTVLSNCTATPTPGAGTVVATTGTINVNDTRNATITALHAAGTGTYSYNSTTGATVINYSTMAGVPANSFAINDVVQLDPTSNALSTFGNALYTITAAAGTTFTVAFPAGQAGTTTGSVNIVDPRTGVISDSLTTAFSVNFGAGKYAAASIGNMNLDIVNKSLKDWSSNSNERFVRIPMVGGVRYDIQLDAYETTSYAKCILSWFSASQTKQVIPAERLYPSSLPANKIAPPAHVTSTDSTALVGGLFSVAIAGSNGAAVSISGNPAWLAYNNGVLSGTPPAGAAGDYQVIVTITNAAGTSTSVVDVHVDENVGSVVREYWNGSTGTSVAGIPTATAPTGTGNLSVLESPSEAVTQRGARVRGYITAPTTGNYYFWVAASGAAELWISNDDEPVNLFKRSWVSTPGNAVAQTWNGQPNQKSPWLALEQGKKYYFEILHNTGAVTPSNLAVGWAKPGEGTSSPSQVVPGYVLSPYLVPPAGVTPGSLYAATMLAQGGAATNGVGTSSMRLNADETIAYMRYSYSNLTGPITSQHIHADPNKEIIYDIDVPATPGDGLITDPSDPNFGARKWTITPVGPFTAANIRQLIKDGKTYINLHTAAFPDGEIRGNYFFANATGTFTPPPATLTWTDDSATDNGAARFLAQASFGANLTEIAALKVLAATGAVPASGTPANRYSTWIDSQFTLAATQHLPEVLAREIGDVFGPFDVRVSFDTWWKTSMTASDQLRQRIAFALSEIHVVSGQGPLEDNSRAISDFYDTLLVNAFGNFRDVLIGTTLTPAMGRYLDMLRNDKPDISVGRSPNENYAREIKQLFSIGLYRMWPDGTLMLTSKDELIDTYTQREIVGLAHVFTGWDYGYDGADRASFSATADWTRPMREVPVRHFTGQKRVLNNEVLPGLPMVGGQPLDPYAVHTVTQYSDPAYKALPAKENNAVHDMLFNHPNVGPFICRQLIQRLVTSNPSRDYLYRVVQKFNDNGSGVRGDMKAVIKAILLDYEARSATPAATVGYGKQREPIMRVANAARALRPSNVTGTYAQTGTSLITITTSSNHLLTDGDKVFLEFTDGTVAGAQPAPTTGTYTVDVIDSTHYTIPAPGWLTGTYSQTAGSSVMTVSMTSHWLPGVNASQPSLPVANRGQAYFDFLSATTGTLPTDGIKTTASSTSFDTPSGVGNVAGNTFTIAMPDTTARTGNVMIARFPGSYSSTGRNGVITIDTSFGGVGTFGGQADHGLAIGDNVFINFANSRDTTSFAETSTENDLVYTITGIPKNGAGVDDPNSFTVSARDAANAAMNSDNQAYVFPLKAQPLVRNGTISTRPSTFVMDNTDGVLQQTPLNSTTVFNFFLPDYKYAGTLATQNITTPEFQLTSETTAIRQANFLYDGIFNPASTTGISSFKSGTNALVMDLSRWMTGNATNLGLGAPTSTTVPWTHNQNLTVLINQLSTLLMAGQLPATAKTTIKNFIDTPIASMGIGAACPVTTTVAHGLKTGDVVLISGVTNGTFGGVANSLNSNTTTRAVTVTGATDGTSTTFTIPLSCTVVPTSGGLTNAHVSVIPYNQGVTAADVTHRRDRLRTILHLILTSPDYTIQR